MLVPHPEGPPSRQPSGSPKQEAESAAVYGSYPVITCTWLLLVVMVNAGIGAVWVTGMLVSVGVSEVRHSGTLYYFIVFRII